MLAVTYDPILVIASILVAIMASFTGLRLTSGINKLDPVARRTAIAKAAVALGSGIWSMHFVGMLAVGLPVVIVYDALPTLISVLLAILVVGLGLILLHFSVRTQLRIAIAGLLTGLTITAMHYTAMLSTTFALGAGVELVSEPSLSSGSLALIVALAAFVICGLFLLMTVPIGIAAAEPAGAEFDGLGSGDGFVTDESWSPAAAGRSTRDTALSKAFSRPPAAQSPPPPRIPYQQDDTVRFLAPSDILAIRANGHYTEIINGKGDLFCPWLISKIEKILAALPFMRIHRSFLVNLSHVSGFRRDGDKGYCVLSGGDALEVPISRSKIPAVQKALGLD